MIMANGGELAFRPFKTCVVLLEYRKRNIAYTGLT